MGYLLLVSEGDSEDSTESASRAPRPFQPTRAWTRMRARYQKTAIWSRLYGTFLDESLFF